MRKPDGVLMADKRLKDMDLNEQQAYLKDLLLHGKPAESATLAPPPGTSAPAAGGVYSSAPQEGGDGETFDPAALYNPSAYRSEQYRMPNGKRLWVHPLAMEDHLVINRQVMQELLTEGLIREDLAPEELQIQAKKAQLEAELRGQVWQTIRCCRCGPLPTDALVFTPDHAPALRRNPGWAEAVQGIALTSNRLANGAGEAALLKELLTGVFGCMGSWLQTLSTRLEQISGSCSDSGPALPAIREALDDFASSVSSLNVQARHSGKLLGSDALAGLGMVLMTSEQWMASAEERAAAGPEPVTFTEIGPNGSVNGSGPERTED